MALVCLVLWITKLWLIRRIGINWDEFYFLSLVHAQARGELSQGLQTAYTHAFAWLPAMRGDEIAQIRAARLLMVILLGLSAWLIRSLASRWFSPLSAWTAVLAFLAMWPTLKHGGSFRADSLLLPLQLGALAVLAHDRLDDRSRGLGAGVLLGAATVVSIKAVLIAPVVAALAFSGCSDWKQAMRRIGWLCAAGLATVATLLGAHYASIQGADSGTANASAGSALQKTVLSARWNPQSTTLQEQVHRDAAFWLIAAAGLAWALWRQRWFAAACALALLPILFYRNSFAYFYVVMWGPACVLFAAAAHGLQETLSRWLPTRVAGIMTLLVPALLAIHGLQLVPALSSPIQGRQQEVISAVHEIFPEPVPYIDHSGMIASFRKSNFFMSTWGVEQYLAQGQPFMPAVLKQKHPPLLLTNRTVITPGTLAFSMLLAPDRRLIEAYYQPYWGPIRIAGASATLQPGIPVVLGLPFGGRYRLDSRAPVLIDGQLQSPQAVVTVDDDKPELRVELDPRGDAQTVRLLWADAHPAPTRAPPLPDYYELL